MSNNQPVTQYADVSHLNQRWSNSLTAVEICATVTEWAARHRWIPPNQSRPGPWRTTRTVERESTKYLIGIMDAMSVDDPCVRVIVAKANQLGGSEAWLNMLGYRVHIWPAPIMLVLPGTEDVSKYVDTRITPTFTASPVLRGLLGKTEEGEKGADNALEKRFAGGALFVNAAKSKGTYRSNPLCVVVLDDLDAFPEHAEGDHLSQAELRTNTYTGRGRKVVAISTPTVRGRSKIMAAYKASSQQRYHVPCMTCGLFQVLERERFQYTRDNPETAHFVCVDCDAAIEERDKFEMVEAGMWKADRPELCGISEGFMVNAAISPFRSWPAMAAALQEAFDRVKQNHDHSLLQNVLNEDWAKVFVPPQEVQLEGLEAAVWKRREPKWAVDILPIVVVTVGTDIQSNRIEATAIGWGAHEECWILEHRVFDGVPEHDPVWDSWMEFCLSYKAAAACVDVRNNGDVMLGHMTKRARAMGLAGCYTWGIQGVRGPGILWPRQVKPGNMEHHRYRAVSIHPDAGKDYWFRGFEIEEAGPGYIHLPDSADKRWIRQVFSERARSIADGPGQRKYLPVVGRPRNEGLDCLVYGRAGLLALAHLVRRIQAEVLMMRTSPVAAEAKAAPRRPRQSSFDPDVF